MERDPPEPGLSGLACYACKRRKVKCNRTFPVCSLCVRTDSTCEYPTYAEKPGPKLESSQKNKRHRSQPKILRPRQAQDHLSAAAGSSESSTTATPLPQNSSPQQSKFWSTPIATATEVVHDDILETGSPAYLGGPTLCQTMYPSHDDHDKEQPLNVTVEAVCRILRIPESTYHTLMASYFDNMTAFSLFKPNSIEGRFSQMNSIVEAEALVASIFSFSARFHAGEEDESSWNYFPSPSYFANMASKSIEDALEPYDDTPPPLWLLQASVLETFYRLTRSVRSKSWRATGNLVRLGYDLKLHLVDVDGQRRDSKGNIDVEFWSAQEERRRCWWAIWELDVFASTIRRLPLGMDWAQTYTFLPIHDSYWFENMYQPSCHLPHDATKRWKVLLESGNTSPRAWFIAINSLMHDAQQLVYKPATNQNPRDKQKAEYLTEIANCLYCTATSLPAGLGYLGETLDFRTKAAPNEASIRQHHADIFGIHIVTQLTRFMIYHQRVCAQAPCAASKTGSNADRGPGGGSPASHGGQGKRARSAADHKAWANYMKAADAIATLVRNSARDSYKYLNPFVAHALWCAAAAQIACLVFGPARYSKSRAKDNYELLALSVGQSIEFWDSAEVLRPRLGKIEAALRNMMRMAEQPDGSHGGGGDDTEMEMPIMMGTSARHGAAEYPGLVGMPAGGDGGLDEQVLEGGMGTVGSQQASTLSFLPIFQEAPLMSQFGAFDDLEYLFPYGMDNVWADIRHPAV